MGCCGLHHLFGHHGGLNSGAPLVDAAAQILQQQRFSHDEVDELITVDVALFCRPNHPLLRHKVINEMDLADFPLAGPRPSHYASEVMESAGENRALTVPKSGGFVPRIWVESFSAMRHAVTASNAVSWAPIALLEPYWRRGELAHLVMRPAPINITYGLASQRHRTPSPAVQAFVTTIRSVAATTRIPHDLVRV